jgi:hypothetical protein
MKFLMELNQTFLSQQGAPMSDDNEEIPRTRPTYSNLARFHQGNVTTEQVRADALRVGDWVEHTTADWCFYEIVRIENLGDGRIGYYDANNIGHICAPDSLQERLTGFAPGVGNINLT